MLKRKTVGDLTVRAVHPKTKCALIYSLADLPGIVTGQEVMIQPVMVDPGPLIIVSYKQGNEDFRFEVKPIEYDAAGFDQNAAVIGREYKAQRDTRRERNIKTLAKITGEGEKGAPFAPATNGEGFKTHSLIQPESNPFVRQRTGKHITVTKPESLLPETDGSETAETVHTHEILISAVEAAKRVKAQCGETPDGFINALREQYPEGVPTRAVDDFIKAHKPTTPAPVNARDVVVHGGVPASPKSKIA
jgi:hypothetical protein